MLKRNNATTTTIALDMQLHHLKTLDLHQRDLITHIIN